MLALSSPPLTPQSPRLQTFMNAWTRPKVPAYPSPYAYTGTNTKRNSDSSTFPYKKPRNIYYKFYTDASFPPETIRRWVDFPTSTRNIHTVSKLSRLTCTSWSGSAPNTLDTGISLLQTQIPPLHIDPLTLDEHSINLIIQFATKSGLARVI